MDIKATPVETALSQLKMSDAPAMVSLTVRSPFASFEISTPSQGPFSAAHAGHPCPRAHGTITHVSRTGTIADVFTAISSMLNTSDYRFDERFSVQLNGRELHASETVEEALRHGSTLDLSPKLNAGLVSVVQQCWHSLTTRKQTANI